jgi:hypothetical protein
VRGRFVLLAVVLATAACSTERPGLVAPDIIYLATPEQVGLEMLRLAGVTGDDLVFDLGSGDGRLVLAAVREFGARGVGVEIDAALVQTSRESAAQAGLGERARFLWQDLFATDISPASVVALYLRDDVNLRLRPKLLRELRPCSRVVSNTFDMADWTPDRVQRVRGPSREHTLFLWVIPASLGGRWEATLGEGASGRGARLDLEQRFQQLTGVLEVDGRRLAVQGVVRGRAVALTTEAWTLRGQVDDEILAGQASGPGGEVAGWTARRSAR